MRLFLLGECKQHNGVGSANRTLLKGLQSQCKVMYSKEEKFLKRLIEMGYKSLQADVLVVCSFTRLNVLGVLIAKLLRKKMIYRLHGYRAFELNINAAGIESKSIKMNSAEQYLFKHADKIICTSKLSMQQIELHEPQWKNKLAFCYNSVEIQEMEYLLENISIQRKKNRIISVGGGVRQKNIYMICKAIEYINNNTDENLELVVIGERGTEIDRICQFPFVVYYGVLSRKEVMIKMLESNLFIQNSIYETFGIAVIEAIIAGCNVLLSKNMGVTEVIGDLEESDIIFDCHDIEEIVAKMQDSFQKSNNARLRLGLREEEISNDYVSEKFFNMVQSVMEG